MRRQVVWIGYVLFLFCLMIPPAAAVENEFFTYEELIELGKGEFSKGRYEESVDYFQRAYALEPSSPNPVRFIQLIKRLRDGRVAFLELDENNQVKEAEPYLLEEKFSPSKPIRSEIVLTHGKKSKEKIKTVIEYMIQEADRKRVAVVEVFEPPIIAEWVPPKTDKRRSAKVTAPPIVVRSKYHSPKRSVVKPAPPKDPAPSKPIMYSTSTIEVTDEKYILRLDDELWMRQPNTDLEIELGKGLILWGDEIERTLVLFPGFYSVEKIDKDRILLKPIKRGRSLLHLWDNRGRWTFNVQVVTPILIDAERLSDADVLQEKNDNFTFTYSNDWNTFYRGDAFTTMERQNLNFRQWMEIYGPTPYGFFDSHVRFTKFQESTEVTGYGVGLSGAKIGNFKDFTIRGYDTSKTFSDLSLPGKYFRGVLFESMAFNRNIAYTYLRGLERTTFGFVSPGVVEEVDSYIEGARMTLFPDKQNNYSFNFARGFGDARNSSLKDKVYSLEAHNRFKDVKVESELAYDEDAFAKTVHTNFKKDNLTLDVNFRDIDKEFLTISGVPAGSGEIGGLLNLGWATPKVDFNFNLDVYRERDVLESPDPEKFNLDTSISVNVPLSADSFLRTDVYYVNTPGLASERKDFRINTNYSKSFQITGYRRLSTFVGGSYQRSRFSSSASSEYDRYRVSGGLRFPIIRNLSYFANYDYSIVEEEATGDRSYPSVFSTGVSYAKQLTDSISTDVSFSYRNEENTEDSFSFLAGEDSITGGVGVRYMPRDGFEFFIDGRVRNVWAEQVNGPAFNEVDVRAGVRTTWDTLFNWSPTGYVEGFVYRDLNGNNRFDGEEQGLKDVVVRVGDDEAVTDKNGHYSITVKARKVRVSLAVESLPEGFIPSGVLQKDVEIVHKETEEVHFGLSVQSGIYGVAYFDVNDNRRLDSEDEFVSQMRITMDGQETYTDYEGVYFFSDVEPGRHTIELDINSLPKEYLPKIKVRTEIDVAEGATYIFHIPLKK